MGQLVSDYISSRNDFIMTAIHDPNYDGQEYKIYKDLTNIEEDIVVEFSPASVINKNIEKLLDSNADLIIGSSGVSAEMLSKLKKTIDRKIIVIPNFSIGAAYQKLFAAALSENFDSVKIIDTLVLPKIINETSGLEILNDVFVTHNDSGGEPSLYFFNLSGEIINSIKIEKENFWEIYNNDWEHITADEDYIYIADTGNNFGTRDNLNIIKVKISDFSVDDKIDIFYSNQDSFFPSSKHEYDAEALLIIEGKIALFSKDRDSLNTDLYLIDESVKEKQELSSVGNCNVNSLITGGDYDSDTGILALVSYSFKGEQYLILFEDFNIDNPRYNSFKKYRIPIERAQIESVKIINGNMFWVTSEDEGIGNPYLYKLELD